MNKHEKNNLNEVRICITNHFNESEKDAKEIQKIARKNGLRVSIVCDYNLYEITNSLKVTKEEKELAIMAYKRYQQSIGQYEALNHILNVLESK